MTIEHGLGMLLLGLTSIALAAIIIFFVINKLEKHEEKKDN
tara:strand:- start:770 stop:892 length:123 start_codon:yes stop_codon:yes gene_type:complete